MDFAAYIVPNPIVIRLAREQESLDNIKQYYVKCRNQDEKLCTQNGRSHDGHSAAVLSGDLTVDQRLDTGSIPNRTSEGIDVEQVTIVVNFDLPMDQQGRADCETYLHRIRRTGRIERNHHQPSGQ
ncbi:DEAD-box helicase Dbp80-like [Topomyia yanbarensis]|uniref:DEAD-box helicase Dbp80-like n=1 Tax=Topomyia yanbarensis TaxID=2498891 RepID=UPI00273BF7AD|nr:DEAD-box helicase Dbp80-like [Topomyia yanbarensis]XP_058840100.1 DEAD-box helicase Dbp80-like [Topomyia yanbarensis]